MGMLGGLFRGGEFILGSEDLFCLMVCGGRSVAMMVIFFLLHT